MLMWHLWAHFKYTLIHKLWVTYYCFEDGLYLQGILHDLSKFTPSEFLGYADFFFKKNGEKIDTRDSSGYYDAAGTNKIGFDYAWNHHQKHNRHHWQYWAMIKDDGSIKCLDIPEIYLREMIADWRGAGKAQGNNPTGGYAKVVEYYSLNKSKIIMSDLSRIRFEAIISMRYKVHGY